MDSPTDSSSSFSGGLPWIDRTSLDIAFDRSCFDALDEQLLHHPVQSFADVCWADAVHDISNERPHRSNELPHRSLISHHPSWVDLAADRDHESDDILAPLPFSNKLNTPGIQRLAEEPYSSFHAKPDTYVHPVLPSTPRQDPFVLLQPHFTQSDPSESIGFFPTRPRARRPSKTPSRFFAYFHARTLARV